MEIALEILLFLLEIKDATVLYHIKYLFVPFLAMLAWDNIVSPVILFLSYLHSLKHDSTFRANLLPHLFVINFLSGSRGIPHACMEGGFTLRAGADTKGIKPLIAELSAVLSQARGAVSHSTLKPSPDGAHGVHRSPHGAKGSWGSTGITSELPAAVSDSLEQTLHQPITSGEQLRPGWSQGLLLQQYFKWVTENHKKQQRHRAFPALSSSSFPLAEGILRCVAVPGHWHGHHRALSALKEKGADGQHLHLPTHPW